VSTRGIDVRQENGQITFRASLKDNLGAKVTTGTTELRIYKLDDSVDPPVLLVLDWTTFAFVATGSGTPDDETTMTHQNRRDSSGADVATGIWTARLTNLTNFEEGQVYLIQVTNSNATPESQEREIQFGGVEGSSRHYRAIQGIAKGTIGTGSTVTVLNVSSLDPTATVPDQFNGRVVVFDKDTTTAALRGQATDITDVATGSPIVLTVTALTTAPQSGDTFTIN